jgi:ATP-grasp domain
VPPRSPAGGALLSHSTGLIGSSSGATLDHAAVADCVQRVGRLADVLPEVVEVEVEPLLVSATSAEPLDVRVRVAPVG